MHVDKLRFGAAYYSEYLPCDRVEADMEMMERAGMNTIRIAESTWSTLEPSEGVFDFTHIDRMLDAAARHHISVIVGTPTYAIPAWLAKKYPDILAVTKNGRELYGRRQNMDITHPDYLRHAERVIRALMDHIRDVPHIIGFQLDNETKSYGTAGPRVQRRFVEYLKERYPDIDTFNREFGLDYWSNRVNSWEEFPDVRGTINQSLSAEFHKFQRSLVTEFLGWQAEIVREYAREDQFITQNFDFEWIGHSYGVQPEVDQPQAARCMTVAGADIYHPSQGNLTGAEITVCGNIVRSLKKDNYLILETQAQGNIEWLPYPGQLRLQAYSHLANGANSVMYWHWHSIHNAIESYWKGVLSHDFSENETYREVCRIGSEWARIGDRLKNLKKTNRIAVLLDNNSLTGLTQFPLGAMGAQSYNTVLRWVCDALYRLNLEFDMIWSTERDFWPYDFLVVPALYSASEELLRSLADYVAAGGNLIATFRSGFSDEQLKIYADTQPHLLHECLGLHYDQYTYPQEVTVRLADKRAVSGKAYGWMEMVIPDTAKPVAVYDHPAWGRYAAVTENTYEEGSALYLGAFFEEVLLEEILIRYFSAHGLKATLDGGTRFPVIVRRGVNDYGKKICYYLNFSGAKQRVLHTGGDGVELIGDEPVPDGEMLVMMGWDVKIIEMR